MNSKDTPAILASDSERAITTILNNVDALIYVADMNTHELLFFNDYGRAQWGEPEGRRCWQVLQKQQQGPCAFCTNSKLTDSDGKSTGVYVWEFQNTRTGQWFQCRDQAIEWVDGHLVRLEIATDITARKHIEQQLEEARQKAEMLADTDMLTGLNNRRAFFNLGLKLLHSARRFEQPASLIMFDLDHFKHINDQYGHAAGDQVLINVGNVCRKTIREADVLARIGGEEFAVLMPQTSREQARCLAERLRQAVETATTRFGDLKIQCTASLGVVSTEDVNLDELSE